MGTNHLAMSSAKPTRECQHCGTADEHGDDFCHDCGHSYDYRAEADPDAEPLDAPTAGTCINCQAEILELSYGIRQCESCGYTVRDWSTA